MHVILRELATPGNPPIYPMIDIMIDINDDAKFHATAQLIHALITTRLDFCNSILYNLPNNKIERLQIDRQPRRFI